MKKKIRKKSERTGWTAANQNGFTLLEVIITLIVASILGSMLYQLLGTGMIESAVSVHRVKEQFELNGMIEEITADYRNFVVKSNNTSQELGVTNLINFKKHIEDNYKQYINIVRVCEYIQPEDPGDTGDPELNQGERILKVNLKKGDQTVTAVFTRW